MKNLLVRRVRVRRVRGPDPIIRVVDVVDLGLVNAMLPIMAGVMVHSRLPFLYVIWMAAISALECICSGLHALLRIERICERSLGMSGISQWYPLPLAVLVANGCVPFGDRNGLLV